MRCSACNTMMEDTEGGWNEELQTHEDLCGKCLTVVREMQADDITTSIPEEFEDAAE